MESKQKLIYSIFTLSLFGCLSLLVLYSKEKPRDLSTNLKGERPEEVVEEFVYKQPVIPKNRSYRIVLVGDSMTKALGPNANRLRQYLIEYYKDNEFVIYNYGYSSTNIESVPERLTQTTINDGVENGAVLNQGFELLILESFGYNPLSGSSLADGLQKQERVLGEVLKLTISTKPESAILFMTPIAPDPVNFAKTTLDLTPEKRREWVEERVQYINNFKKYAEANKIPLIDIYGISLNKDGSVNPSYISNDFIHPSEKGIDLMAREIASFIAVNKIFPE